MLVKTNNTGFIILSKIETIQEFADLNSAVCQIPR